MYFQRAREKAIPHKLRSVAQMAQRRFTGRLTPAAQRTWCIHYLLVKCTRNLVLSENGTNQ